MFKRYGSGLLLLAALLLVCLPSLREPAAQLRPDAVPRLQDAGALHYISDGTVRLDINLATAAEFAELPEIGETLAQRIIEYRDAHGAFDKIDDLMNVSGLGQKKFDAIAPYIGVKK